VRGILLELAKAGADVVIAQRDVKKAELVVAELKAFSRRGMTVRHDVTHDISLKKRPLTSAGYSIGSISWVTRQASKWNSAGTL
jgi:NAD(P)-dependent dehydrogenase (short-subunit alcohol dehydrogenase family)